MSAVVNFAGIEFCHRLVDQFLLVLPKHFERRANVFGDLLQEYIANEGDDHVRVTQGGPAGGVTPKPSSPFWGQAPK